MTPRPLLLSDLQGALLLWRRLLAAGFDADPRFAPADDPIGAIRAYARDLWTRTDPFPHAMVSDGEHGLAGIIVGLPEHRVAVLADPPTVRITDLWVEPWARRRGLGRVLVTAFCDAARASGHRNVEVGTLQRDHRAVAFWKAMGFEPFRVTLQRHLGPGPTPGGFS